MLTQLDWIIIIGFLTVFVLIALSFTNKAGKNLTTFFLGGRNLPWYIAGVSMVATTFAADTPLAVTEIVAKNGIAGNWIWWNALAGGMLTTFFFANLWRRSGVLTEVELIELRYSGKPASFLRGFKAIYLGVLMNVVVIAWVNLALASLLQVFFELNATQSLFYTALAMLVVAIYSSLSGLLGVAITDAIQFIVAIIGCIILAVLVVNSEKIGGLVGLKQQIPKESLQFFPTISGEASILENAKTYTIGIGAFFAFATIQWWASWYPGAEPGGGGYIAQRMMSTKNEKHAVYATLFFQIAHYCIRPWPWILVALAALVLYPDLMAETPRMGFVYAMRDFLPPGLKGLLLVAFFAAYMSTISTQLNWGASYLTNDIYKRFIAPNSTDKQQVLAARLSTVVLMVLGFFVTTQLDSIKGAWEFVIECGAGLGLVLILRWYWWRINAWAEITATIVPFIVFAACKYYGIEFPQSFFITVGITTISWLIVMLFTPPTNDDHIMKFYLKVKPDGLWGNVKQRTNHANEKSKLASLAICWVSALVFTYSILFLIGKILFLEWEAVKICIASAFVSWLILQFALRKTQILKR